MLPGMALMLLGTENLAGRSPHDETVSTVGAITSCWIPGEAEAIFSLWNPDCLIK